MAQIARAIGFEKYAGEILDQGVNFAGELIDGETVSGGDIEIYDVVGNTVTDALAPNGAAAAETVIQYRLEAEGIPGKTYHVYVYALLNTGEKIGQLLVMSIPKP